MSTNPSFPALPVERKNAPPVVIVSLCAIFCGLGLAEQISNNILPLTLRRFTENASIIGAILAIHPIFGFVTQPLVGVLSDRIWTPVGRRAFFLITCAPLAAVCLVLVPRLPALWQLIAVVVLFQFFLAMLWGSDHPLIADLVPAPQRTLVKGCMMTSGQITTFLFVKYGLGRALDRFGEPWIYGFVAAALVVLIAAAAFFLNEQPLPPSRRPRLTVRRYVGDLFGDPVLRRFGFLGLTQALASHIVAGFVVLFAVQTVHVSKAQFGNAWSTQALISLTCAIPLGWVVERLPKPWVLVAGFAFSIAGCLLGWFAHDAHSFFAIALLVGFGGVVGNVTFKPFFSEYLPRDIIGQLTGAYNICYAVGRSLALAGGGWLVGHLGNNYRFIWIVAVVFNLLSALIAASIPDVRYARRKTARPEAGLSAPGKS